MSVRQATESDLQTILQWLEEEHRETGEGFWCNEAIIAKSLIEGDLWVIRQRGEAVAFQVGDYAADIACVRRDCQRQGLGTELFEASLARAMRDGVNVMAGECSPSSSLPFWESKGFVRYGVENSVLVRRILQRPLEIPSASSIANVTIEFFPEEVRYKAEVAPAEVHCVRGGRTKDGIVHLERRVIWFDGDARNGKDVEVKIDVDGETRCFCKAKYEQALAAGVKRDWKEGTYIVDAVLPEIASLTSS